MRNTEVCKYIDYFMVFFILLFHNNYSALPLSFDTLAFSGPCNYEFKLEPLYNIFARKNDRKSQKNVRYSRSKLLIS